MRKLWIGVVVAALSVALAQAGAPGGEGGGRGGGRGGRGGDDMRRRMFEAMRGGGGFGGRGGSTVQIDVFETARKLAELNDNQKADVQGLDDQYELEEREARLELTRALNKKYIALVLELLPDDVKPKYEKVLAAMTERELATETARKALITVLEGVRKEQGADRQGPPDMIPSGKSDIIRRYIKLADAQRTEADELRRDGFGAMREAMQGIQRPNDFRDQAAMAKFMEAMRAARQKVDDKAATAMAGVLNEAQKAAYAKGETAFDGYQAKIKEIDAAYKAKLVEAVGEEKAQELQQRRPRFGGGRPGGGPPGGGRPGGGRPAGGGGQGGERPAPRTEF